MTAWMIYGCKRCRLLGLGLVPLLTGCTGPLTHQPPATADTVLAAQYQASGRHGAITGEEAGKITDNYLRQIGTATPPPKTDGASTRATRNTDMR